MAAQCEQWGGFQWWRESIAGRMHTCTLELRFVIDAKLQQK